MTVKRVYKRTCAGCGKRFIYKLGERIKYCSSTCKKEYYRKKYWPDRPKEVRPTGTTGGMHEMLVAVDLLRRGMYVFRSVTANSPFDLVAFDGKKLIRVEVTTGSRTKSGCLAYVKRKDKSKFDLLAICRHSGEIYYLPDLK